MVVVLVIKGGYGELKVVTLLDWWVKHTKVAL